MAFSEIASAELMPNSWLGREGMSWARQIGVALTLIGAIGAVLTTYSFGQPVTWYRAMRILFWGGLGAGVPLATVGAAHLAYSQWLWKWGIAPREEKVGFHEERFGTPPAVRLGEDTLSVDSAHVMVRYLKKNDLLSLRRTCKAFYYTASKALDSYFDALWRSPYEQSSSTYQRGGISLLAPLKHPDVIRLGPLGSIVIGTQSNGSSGFNAVHANHQLLVRNDNYLEANSKETLLYQVGKDNKLYKETFLHEARSPYFVHEDKVFTCSRHDSKTLLRFSSDGHWEKTYSVGMCFGQLYVDEDQIVTLGYEALVLIDRKSDRKIKIHLNRHQYNLVVNDDWIFVLGKVGTLFKLSRQTGEARKIEVEGNLPSDRVLGVFERTLFVTTDQGTLLIDYTSGQVMQTLPMIPLSREYLAVKEGRIYVARDNRLYEYQFKGRR